MITTDWRQYSEGSHEYRIRVRYGFDVTFAKRNNQAPYFTITFETEVKRRGRWHEDSCGAGDEPIRAHFPELAPLLPWHLCGTDGPMHYEANSVYHWEQMKIEYFKSACVFGALPDDGAWLRRHIGHGIGSDAVRVWLRARKPALMEAFRAAMLAGRIVYPE